VSSPQIISADELRDLMADAVNAKLDERAEEARREKQKEKELHQEFLKRELSPDLAERISKLVRIAAARGESELLVFTFPSKFCSDGGRTINIGDPNWPNSLQGQAKRGYDFFVAELKPLGFRLTAQILDFPGGFPGDVGFRLKW
jgi:hypothetical protein